MRQGFCLCSCYYKGKILGKLPSFQRIITAAKLIWVIASIFSHELDIIFIFHGESNYVDYLYCFWKHSLCEWLFPWPSGVKQNDLQIKGLTPQPVNYDWLYFLYWHCCFLLQMFLVVWRTTCGWHYTVYSSMCVGLWSMLLRCNQRGKTR